MNTVEYVVEHGENRRREPVQDILPNLKLDWAKKCHGTMTGRKSTGAHNQDTAGQEHTRKQQATGYNKTIQVPEHKGRRPELPSMARPQGKLSTAKSQGEEDMVRSQTTARTKIYRRE